MPNPVLETIQLNATLYDIQDAGAARSSSLADVATSGKYTDLTNKPKINDVTVTGSKSLATYGIQGTISDLDTIRSGATAGSTAYQKPSGGIPSSDMTSTVQTDLSRAAVAMRGFVATNISLTFTADTSQSGGLPTYAYFPYRATYTNANITASMIPTAAYSLDDAMSQSYAPICESFNGGVYFYAKSAATTTLPSLVLSY